MWVRSWVTAILSALALFLLAVRRTQDILRCHQCALCEWCDDDVVGKFEPSKTTLNQNTLYSLWRLESV